MKNLTNNSTSYEVSFHNNSNYVTIYSGSDLNQAVELYVNNLNLLNSNCKDDNSEYELELIKRVDNELTEWNFADFTETQAKLLKIQDSFSGWIIEGNFDSEKAPIFVK